MRAFAAKLGIKENRYARYERGDVRPRPAMLHLICKSLGVAPEDLLKPVSRPAIRQETAGRAATGFAERPRPTELDASNDNGPAQRHRLSARVWRLSAVLARARGSSSADIRGVATIYRHLRDDPIGQLASLAAEMEEKAWTGKLKSEIKVAIAAILQHFDDLGEPGRG